MIFFPELNLCSTLNLGILFILYSVVLVFQGPENKKKKNKVGPRGRRAARVSHRAMPSTMIILKVENIES